MEFFGSLLRILAVSNHETNAADMAVQL